MTTVANIDEISNLEEVLQRADLPENITVKADKGYQSRKNADLLAKRNLKNHVLKKARGNLSLHHWEKKFNKLIGRISYNVERTFGRIRRWFGEAVARYNGIEKNAYPKSDGGDVLQHISKSWYNYVQFCKKQQKVRKNSKK